MVGKDSPKIIFLEHQVDPDADSTSRLARLKIINRQSALHRHSKARNRKKVQIKQPLSGSSSLTPETPQEKSKTASRRNKLAHRDQGTLQSKPNDARGLLPTASICSPVINIDGSKHQVFQYFAHYWMPSARHMPLGCQITGFTPVWPGDYELSKKLLTEALQSSTIVSAYAILTVSARRMQLVSNRHNGHGLPEVYAAKAIKALRTVVEEKRQLPERLILDISYLVLSEVYVKAPKKPEVYGKMIKDLIVMYGGLLKITPFTAQACLAWDNLMSATTLVAPSLDPFRFPELLSPISADSQLDTAEREMETYLLLQQLQDRPRIMASESQSFSRMIAAIQKLPRCARDGIKSLVAQSSAKVFRVLTAPFLFLGDPMRTMRVDEVVATADGQFMHVKVQMYLTWLWHSAVGYLSLGTDMMDSLYPTPTAARQTSKLRMQIEGILDTLADRSWMFQDGLLLWLAAVGALAADTEAERQAYAGLVTRSANNLFIEDELGLNSLLEAFPPLQRMEAGANSYLWNLICSYRLSVDWNETPSIASLYEPSPRDGSC